MADPQDVMRRVVSMAVDTPQLQAQLQRKLTGCQQPQHQVLLRICLDHRERRSLIGDRLDTHVCQDDGTSSASVLLPGILLLLHLCDLAQYGVNITATACAALAALLARDASTHPQFSAADVRQLAECVIAAHTPVLVAAMQHEGLAAELAQQRPDAILLLAAVAYSEAGNATGARKQQLERQNAELFSAFQSSAVQAATHTASLPAARSALQIRQLSMATRLLLEAVPHQRAQASAILAAAVGLQALCLASRPSDGGGGGGSGVGGSAAAATAASRNLHSLSHSMIRASAAAQEAARQLLLEQPAAQAPTAEWRSAAEAALQSIVHLCRWACNPLQGRYPTKAAAEAQFHLTLGLLSEAAGGDSSTNGGKSGSGRDGGGSSGVSLCAAAVAAAGSIQLQRCAAGLADLLVAASKQLETAAVAPQLGAAARLLRCMCGCFDVFANGSGRGSSSSGSASFPVTVACLHSRQGRRLLRTRVAAPSELLAAVVVWFDKASKGPFSAFLQLEEQKKGPAEGYTNFLSRIAGLVDDMAALLSASALQLLGGCRCSATAWAVLQRLETLGALAALITTLHLPRQLTGASAGGPPAAAGDRQRQRQQSHGLCGGCGLAIQALAAAVAVGELALCSPPPAVRPARPVSSGAAPSPAAAAARGDYAAAGAGAAGQAADDTAAATAATGHVSEPAKSAILLQLMACSLTLGEQSQRIMDENAEAHAAEIAAVQADDLAAAKSKSATAGSRQRRLGKAVEADVRAGQAASGRLLATAVAGMAGLAAAAAQRSAGATGQQRNNSPAAQRPLEADTDGISLKNLLRRSTQLAMSALYTAQHMPDVAAELIEGGCALLAGVAVAIGGLPQDATTFWHDRRVSLRQQLGPADARRLAPMFQQVDKALRGTLSSVVPSAAGFQAQREAVAAAVGRSRTVAAAAAAAALLEEEQSSAAAAAAAARPRHGSGDVQQPPGAKQKAKQRMRQKAAKAAT